MKIKNILGFICMLITTILGSILIFVISLIMEISSNGIMNAANKTNYFEMCKKDINEVLLNYMPQENVDSVLEEVDINTSIIGLINGFDSIKIDALAGDLKETVREKVKLSLNGNITEENKQEFSNVVSNAFVSEIFPSKEFHLVSSYYNKYVPYLELGTIVVLVLLGIIYIGMLLWKENRKWLIVSLYNILILSVIIAIMLSMFDNIVIGSEKTTSLVLGIISNIKENMYILSGIFFTVSIVLNYLF